MTYRYFIISMMVAVASFVPSTVLAAQSTNEQLRAQIAALLIRVSELEAKLNKYEVVTSSIKTSDGIRTASLQIEDVRSLVTDDSVVVSWRTSAPAESRLILNNGKGKVLESGFGTKHSITVNNLKPSTEYDFKITAQTKDKSGYDDAYDSFTAKKEYRAVLISKYLSDKKCSQVAVQDTAGNPVKNTKILVKSVNKAGASASAQGSTELKTNKKGEFKYCKAATSMIIKSDSFNLTLNI